MQACPRTGAGREGVLLDDGMTQPADVFVFKGDERAFALDQMGEADIARAFSSDPTKRIDDSTMISISIREGRKRQVKRMLSAIGHPVIALHRPSFGPLELGELPRGEWRHLTEGEKDLIYREVEDAFRG